MNIDIEEERQRLAQGKFLKWINHKIQPTEMITVYLNDLTDDHNFGIYCALIPNDQIDRSLNDPSWDLHLGAGLPGTVKYHRAGEEEVRYLRYGDDTGIEPLVIYREFHGMREGYLEISEEFRLFHQLYHSRKQDQYIKIDDSGNEHVIAVVEPSRVQIRLQEIRQFLAIKDMHLTIMFDCREDSGAPLKDLGLAKSTNDGHDGLLTYMLGYSDFGGLTGKRAFSRLLGKRLIQPFPKDKSGFWGFERRTLKKYVEFTIGQDDDGTAVTNTSDPNRLANFFGANFNQPHYLTPVHFRQQVLDRYYQQPSKYSVEDSFLRCGGL